MFRFRSVEPRCVCLGTERVSSGSVSTDELQTTFYCSSRGSDGAAIQSALDAASNTSGLARVVIDPIDAAPYVATNAPLLVYDDTVVEIREDVKLGDGQDHNLFESEGCHGDSPTVRDNIHIIGNGGALDGNNANNTATLSPAGFYANCINLMATNSSVRRVRAENAVWHGINIHGHSESVEIVDNHVVGGQGGIQAHWHEADDTTWSNVKITGNTVEDAATASTNAIMISGGENARATENTVLNCGGRGITAYNGDNALGLDSVTIADNFVKGATASGVSVKTHGNSGTGVTNVSVTANTIKNSGASGVKLNPDGTSVEDITISANTIADSTARGIFVTDNQGGSGPGTDNVAISDNIINGTTDWSGIQVAYDCNTDTTIVGNKVKNAGYNGAQVSGPEGEFVSNTFKQNALKGVVIQNPHWVVADNICKNNGQDTSNDGIALNADDIIVRGNRCFDDQDTKTQNYGIRIEGGDYQIITGNNVRGNVNSGISGTLGANSIQTNNIT